MSSELGWIIMTVVTILILVVDVYLYADKIPGNTWSQIVIAKSKNHIWYPFVWGILMGHWFF